MKIKKLIPIDFLEDQEIVIVRSGNKYPLYQIKLGQDKNMHLYQSCSKCPLGKCIETLCWRIEAFIIERMKDSEDAWKWVWVDLTPKEISKAPRRYAEIF